MRTQRKISVLSLAAVAEAAVLAQHVSADAIRLEETLVAGVRVANERPAATYQGVLSALRFDPQVELQPRGMPEGQADITVRGGVFENTALRIGAATVFDPQTGHYAANVPIDPGFLTAPQVALDIEHAVAGSNATLATLQYDFAPVDSGGQLRLGVGTHGLNYQQLRGSLAGDFATGTGGIGIALARSSGDGTESDGDHRFERVNLRGQWRDETSQTDVIAAYQDKFYGWPGAYTGFASLPETDETQTTLWMLGHRREVASGQLTLTGFHRTLVDDYDFNRRTEETGVPGAFEHKTRIQGLGLSGDQGGERLRVRWSLQYSEDELVRSTDLVGGSFASREYLSARVVPEYEWRIPQGSLALQAGLATETSNRDEDSLEPVAGLSFTDAEGSNTIGLSYTGSSQLPGYTALKSPPQGLFGGNPELGREYARQLTLSWRHAYDSGDWTLAGFLRRDDDLVDWTYNSALPSSRQANGVDIDVSGIEFLWQQAFSVGALNAGLTWLDKDADYGDAAVDASFYALNYAEWRATLGVVYALRPELEFRVDTEWRQQADNPLRQSSREALLGAASLNWSLSERLSLSVIVDNLVDSDFEFFPGTPAVGRQASLSASYQL